MFVATEMPERRPKTSVRRTWRAETWLLMPSRIEDYALIGDCETAALVSKSGSIDWLCWPRFELGRLFFCIAW